MDNWKSGAECAGIRFNSKEAMDMLRFKPTRLSVAVALAAVVILVAGGASVASNMGFKLNKPLVVQALDPFPGGANWTSVPFNNPYTTINSFCLQAGLRTNVGLAPRITIEDDSNNTN